MSNNPTPIFGSLAVGSDQVQLSPIPLNVLYFDGAPCMSFMNGIIGVTLTVTANVPVGDGGPARVASVVAHLKCNVAAALALKSAIEGALLLAQPVENSEGPAN